jgi:hypothetical protein
VRAWLRRLLPEVTEHKSMELMVCSLPEVWLGGGAAPTP